MPKYFLHIIIFILLLANACTQSKKTDWDLSFDRNNKMPYGCHIAFHSLENIFSKATIESTKNPMRKIFNSNKNFNNSKNSLTIIVVNSFDVDSIEIDEMMKYVYNGNSICILSNFCSDTLLNHFSLKDSVASQVDSFSLRQNIKSGSPQKIGINDQNNSYEYQYIGRKFNHFFIDNLNENEDQYMIGYIDKPTQCNLLQYKNNGIFLFGQTPLAFTNHFMLQDSNRNYYAHLLSHFDDDIETIYWASGLIHSAGQESKNSSLFNFPPLFKAFIIMLILLLFFTLFESKRRQRLQNILPKKENASLEFTETVGRLYYHKQDHKNLSNKMILHYLEHCRSHFGMRTTTLNEEFAMMLSAKSNQEINDTKSFVAYLNYIRNESVISEMDLKHLYHQLKKFE